MSVYAVNTLNSAVIWSVYPVVETKRQVSRQNILTVDGMTHCHSIKPSTYAWHVVTHATPSPLLLHLGYGVLVSTDPQTACLNFSLHLNPPTSPLFPPKPQYPLHQSSHPAIPVSQEQTINYAISNNTRHAQDPLRVIRMFGNSRRHSALKQVYRP